MKLFISYRRDDSGHAADRLYRALERFYGDEVVFCDVASISAGKDFRRTIIDELDRCSVCIVLIGPSWLTAKRSDGTRRIDHEDDYVRFEVETAIKKRLVLIPVLLDGVTCPTAEKLPAPIKELGYRQALRLRRDPDFQHDIETLIDQLERSGGGKGKPRSHNDIDFSTLGF